MGIAMDAVKWLAQQAAVHKYQAKKVSNKEKRKVHKLKAKCYQMALNGYMCEVDKDKLTSRFGFGINLVSKAED
jgi:hypothetical protein